MNTNTESTSKSDFFAAVSSDESYVDNYAAFVAKSASADNDYEEYEAALEAKFKTAFKEVYEELEKQT